MKRIISALLVLVMLCAVIPFSAVSAATPSTYPKNAYDIVVEGMLEYAKGTVEATADPEEPGVYYGEPIDINAYNLTTEQTKELMQDILDNEPMLFYMHLGYSYLPDDYDGHTVYVQPMYVMTPEEAATATEFVNEEVEYILSTVPEDLDDYQTALYLYEYIAFNFDYDYDYEIYDIYYFLRTGYGVCQSYTLLYDELLTRSGIANYGVVSNELVHIWNEIKLGGKWYQVDITWGDYGDPFNLIDYDYFLMSNSESAYLHNSATDIVVKYDCTDTYFDDISWKDYNMQFAFAIGDTYRMDQNGEYIQELNLLTGKTRNVFYIGTENNEYYQSQIWSTYSHVGSYDERLIYNSGSKIMYYDPLANELGLLYNATVGNILQMTVFNGIVTYSPSDDYYNSDIYYYIIDFSKATSAEKPVDPNGTVIPDPVDALYGDVNLDGVVDKKDYALLKRYCFSTVLLSEDALVLADVNHDGAVDKKDYALVKRHCFGTYVIL